MFDYCYECTAYGDDYYINDDGELKKRCSQCWVMMEGEE